MILSGLDHLIAWRMTVEPEANRAPDTSTVVDAAGLQAKADRFQGIIERTDAGYFRIGLDGRYEDVNPAWLRMYGFTHKEEAIGLHFSAVQVPADREKAEATAAALLRGESVREG